MLHYLIFALLVSHFNFALPEQQESDKLGSLSYLDDSSWLCVNVVAVDIVKYHDKTISSVGLNRKASSLVRVHSVASLQNLCQYVVLGHGSGEYFVFTCLLDNLLLLHGSDILPLFLHAALLCFDRFWEMFVYCVKGEPWP